ncbi:MAG: hypothetical protein FWC79_01540 [Oscillospiraceae bacterium]|nr:hypothetical protein [Oscillospiraceae bacterium]
MGRRKLRQRNRNKMAALLLLFACLIILAGAAALFPDLIIGRAFWNSRDIRYLWRTLADNKASYGRND